MKIKDSFFKAVSGLADNQANEITYYENGKRRKKSFAEFYQDVCITVYRLKAIAEEVSIESIGILGPTSYYWLVMDIACLLGGYRAVGLPEDLSAERLEELIDEASVDLLLVDTVLRDSYGSLGITKYFYGEVLEFSGSDLASIETEPECAKSKIDENLIREDFYVGFSSGTSGKPKKIEVKFWSREKPVGVKKLLSLISKPLKLFQYKVSFWSKKDNKLIIYMPFSHIQQRDFARIALFRGFDIVLSDPKNCVFHLIKEKPNIMVSVPIVYETLAEIVQGRLAKMTVWRKRAWAIYKSCGINRWAPWNPIKRVIDSWLFKEVRRYYGGRADYFVTGSAPVSRSTLELFYSIGVRIYESYGQSESGIIAMNDVRNFRLGSVGKPQLEIKIAEDSEVLVRYMDQAHDARILNLTDDGYIRTGDIGYLDKDGFLFLEGRKDEVLVMKNGKKIYPSNLEKQLESYEGVSHAFITSYDKEVISVVLCCSGIDSDSGRIEAFIEEVNRKNAPHERIEDYYLEESPFSVESGLLTRNLKYRRQQMRDHYGTVKLIPVNAPAFV